MHKSFIRRLHLLWQTYLSLAIQSKPPLGRSDWEHGQRYCHWAVWAWTKIDHSRMCRWHPDAPNSSSINLIVLEILHFQQNTSCGERPRAHKTNKQKADEPQIWNKNKYLMYCCTNLTIFSEVTHWPRKDN